VTMDVEAAVTKQVEVAVELDHLLPAGSALAYAVAQHGEIRGDVAATKAGLRPERVDDLVALVNDRCGRELADISGVIEVHVPENHVIDVGGFDADLVQLSIDRDVGGAARIERGNERPPISRVGDDLVVIPGIEEHVPFGMLDQEEGDRNRDLSGSSGLQPRFV